MRWLTKTADPAQTRTLASELSRNPALKLDDPKLAATLAQLLVQRGISDPETAERFLAPSLSH
ncbi:MAG TPA: hypothetical protein VJQ82_28575, partial [Terriglobales bacterium]|nr:hypothetical protein [Terriglobales bacterium]